MTQKQPDVIENAVAVILAVLPPDLLIKFALSLNDMAERRVHGGLDCSFNMTDGKVRSADFAGRSHWRPTT